MFQQKSSLLQFTSPNFIQVDSNFRLWFLAMILNCGSDHWHKNDRHLSSRLQIKHWILLHMKQIQWIPSANQLSMLQVDWVALKCVLLWKKKEFSKLHPPWPHRSSQAKSPWRSSLLRPLAQRNRPGTIASALGFCFFSLVAFSQPLCGVTLAQAWVFSQPQASSRWSTQAWQSCTQHLPVAMPFLASPLALHWPDTSLHMCLLCAVSCARRAYM